MKFPFMNIAVQSPNWIGDGVMCLPALRALKYYYPENKIHLVCRAHLQDIFVHIREIDEIIPLEDRGSVLDMLRISRRLRPYRFRQGILFTNSFRSAFIFRLAGIGNLAGYQKDLRGLLLARKVKIPRNRKHHAFFYLDLVKILAGKRPDNRGVEEHKFSDALVIEKQERDRVRRVLKQSGISPQKILIGISPSAAFGVAKEWLPDRFEELMKMIMKHKKDIQILLFGSEREASRVSAIKEKSGSGVLNLAGKLSLREVIVAISFCSLFISNDSGLMHVASSLKLPVIALFGPTVPLKTSPLHSRSKVIYHRVDCAPCLHRQCPQDHRCMKAISVKEVFEETMNLLPKSSRRAVPAGQNDR